METTADYTPDYLRSFEDYWVVELRLVETGDDGPGDVIIDVGGWEGGRCGAQYEGPGGVD